MYDDDDVIKTAAKKLVVDGIHITDVFSPFPIHGIDPIIGVKHTRMGNVAFLFGLLGRFMYSKLNPYVPQLIFPQGLQLKPGDLNAILQDVKKNKIKITQNQQNKEQ